ncbi:MAG: hypothetical protein PHC62_02020 [Candidatus Izemoplasmatales bacterium]|nr:hypothetical protein [Candidatus Izemoplasmatales bacterium]
MKKYLSLLKYEFKTIFKSSMSVFMLLYPVLMLFITGFILPAVLEKTTSANSNATTITLLIGFVLTLSMGGFLMGAMLGFSLIENKDENTLINIATTPVTVSGYTTFKVIYTTILAFFANLVLIGGLKLIASNKYIIVFMGNTIRLLDRISIGQMLIFAVVASLVVPMIALVIGAIAKNKVEGFAFMKSSGIIIMIPLLALLNTFQDWKQYLLGIVPNFWAVKALLNLVLDSQDSSNLSFNMYMVIGGIITLIIGYISFRFFVRKSNLK